MAIPAYLQLEHGKDYVVQKVLETGGTSDVMLARVMSEAVSQKINSHYVIVKSLRTFPSDIDQNLKLEDIFNHEVALVSYFSNYSHFTQFIGYDPTKFAIIMKYYSRGSLKSYYGGSRVWKKSFIANFSLDICRGVQFLHEKGFVHCDLKPTNILIDDSQFLKRKVAIISDFGMTRSIDSKNMKVRAFRRIAINGATMMYAAPEVLMSFRDKVLIANPTIAKASDIYSIAIIIWEQLHLRRPW